MIPWGERPLVVGEIRASQNADTAPTILLYGHFDVQPPDPLELWDSDPFELVERDDWLYARGIADDKGQLYMLLKAAELLAAAGELPVNLRIACDGEEEIGGHSIVDWIAADERGADAAIVFDSGMVERDVPGFNIAVRGVCYFHVKVRTGTRDLHSGMYGGASLNALHALMQTLSGVLPRDGRLPEPLRAGIVSPSASELDGWKQLPAGDAEIAAAGSRPADATAAEEFYLRTWAEPSVDVNGIAGGSPTLQKTVIAVEAEANVSIRLVADQDPDVDHPGLRAAPPRGGAGRGRGRVRGLVACAPRPRACRRAGSPARPRRVRGGARRPAAAHSLGRRDSARLRARHPRRRRPILTGFALNESNIHSPNERIPAAYLPLGIETAAALYRHLADLG